MKNATIVNTAVIRRANKAKAALEQMLQLVSRDWPEDFEGDYKDAASLEEDLLWAAAAELEVDLKVLTEAYSCPRSWLIEVRVGNDSVTYPQR